MFFRLNVAPFQGAFFRKSLCPGVTRYALHPGLKHCVRAQAEIINKLLNNPYFITPYNRDKRMQTNEVTVVT